jgi:hypothetical protein
MSSNFGVYADTPLHHLEEARALIADPANWCVGMNSRTLEDGTKQYCSSGALLDRNCTMSHTGYQLLLEAFQELHPQKHPHDAVCIYNDKLLHEDVLAAFDLAISKVKGLQENRNEDHNS